MATGDRLYFPEQLSIAPLYNPASTYKVGDYVSVDGKVKKITTVTEEDDGSFTYELAEAPLKEYVDTKLDKERPVAINSLSVEVTGTTPNDVGTSSGTIAVGSNNKNEMTASTNYYGYIMLGKDNVFKGGGQRSAVIGNGNIARASDSIIIGEENDFGNDAISYSIIGGSKNNIPSTYSLVVGYRNQKSGTNNVSQSIIAGQYNEASGSSVVCLGRYNKAKTDDVMLGTYNNAGKSVLDDGTPGTYDGHAYCLGTENDAHAYGSVAIGYNCTSVNQYAVSMGDSSIAYGQASLAAGNNSHAKGMGSIALGYQTRAFGGDGSISLGYNNVALGRSSVAMGRYALTGPGANTAIALGENVSAMSGNSIAEGYRTMAFNSQSHAGGYYSVAQGYGSFTFGQYCCSDGNNSIALGSEALTIGDTAFAVGYRSKALGSRTVAIGQESMATGVSAVAFSTSQAYGEESFAASNGVAIKDNSVAIGKKATAYKSNQVVLGMYNYYDDTIIEDDVHSESQSITVFNTATSLQNEGTNYQVKTNKVKQLSFQFYIHPDATDIEYTNLPSILEATDLQYTASKGRVSVNKTLAEAVDAGGMYTIRIKYKWKTKKIKQDADTGNSIFVIGNGTSEWQSSRSNAFTVDGSGDAHVNKDLYVGAGKTCEEGLKVATEAMLGDEYNPESTYAVGDIVIYNNKLYECKEAIDTPEDFDEDKWNVTKLTNLIGGGDSTLTDRTTGAKYKIFVDNGIIGLEEVN